MAPKRPPTAAEKGKKKATGSTSKRARLETTDSSHYLSKEHEERFKNHTSQWSIWGERKLQLEDFPHFELYNLIDICGWKKLQKYLRKIYSQLIHEFYTNFNHKIDIHGTEHYGQTWIRGTPAIFPALISGICEEAGVQILPAELVVKAKGPINYNALENARRHTAHSIYTTTDT
ncbi:Uncharacterized protein Adt_05706 [Abeliophyllum distichum]|uniref:Uncharacterized protein n=1 Tax=Abeliophyllum distichum TaxID=126358 RepID=A0ABD1V6X7_9LAMI